MSDDTRGTTPTARGRRRRRRVLGGLVAVLVVGAVVALAAGRLADEPAGVDLTVAADAAEREDGPLRGGGVPAPTGGAAEVEGDDGDDGEADATAPVADVGGVWVADPDAQSFDRAAGTGTFLGYRVAEELSSVGAFTAVGRTPRVEAEITIEGATVVSASVEGDLASLQSDDGRRDGRVRRLWRDDARARFELTSPVDVPTVASDGEVVEVPAEGRLTIDGVTREVEVLVQATTRGERIVVAGATSIALADFGVVVPSAAIVLSVSDEATIEWQVFFRRT